jgi:Cysteine-rich CPXCG
MWPGLACGPARHVNRFGHGDRFRMQPASGTAAMQAELTVCRGRASRRMRPVKRRKSSEMDSLRRSIASRAAEDIDRLYGLEPVYDPAAAPLAGLEPERFVPVQCPYCGERLETRVDLTAGEREYIEDCQVCCRPIELSVELDDSGALQAVRVQRQD